MPRTPDRRAGPRFEEKLILDTVDQFGEPVVAPAEAGGVTYPNGSFAMRDYIGVFNPRSAATPFAVSFTNKRIVTVSHQRGTEPLVQVILPQPFGWNMEGWGDLPWNAGQGAYVRMPDDQYTLRHFAATVFQVVFSTLVTGKVLYF